MPDASNISDWLTEHRIRNVEISVSDMAGTPRGKVLPVTEIHSQHLKLPRAVFAQTVSGNYYMGPDNRTDKDMRLRPDWSTLRLVPWSEVPNATVIMDCFDDDGATIDVAPRAVLKKIVAAYESKGWNPVVAPEMEFCLAHQVENSCAQRESRSLAEVLVKNTADPYGTERLNDLSGFFDRLRADCDAQGIVLGGILQELGPAQFEVNFKHGPPIRLADDVVRFKRIIRRAAAAYGMQPTFMAKTSHDGPGSSMHVHQSIYDVHGQNIFSTAEGGPSDHFDGYLGGLQQLIPEILLLLAPYANSYRRFLSYYSSPVNLEWGVDNRSVGIRVPISDSASRRIENRLAGSDVNPYLAIAATLACGYRGIARELRPRPAVEGSAYDLPFALHRHLYEALDCFRDSAAAREVFGEQFVTLYSKVKELEYRDFQEHVTEWEREFLMFSV